MLRRAREFRASRAGLRQEYGQASVIGVRAGADLARLRPRGERGIIERPSARSPAPRGTGRRNLAQVQRDGENAHDPRREVFHRRVIRPPGLRKPSGASARWSRRSRSRALGIGEARRGRAGPPSKLSFMSGALRPTRPRERLFLRPETAVRGARVVRLRALLQLGRQGEEASAFVHAASTVASGTPWPATARNRSPADRRRPRRRAPASRSARPASKRARSKTETMRREPCRDPIAASAPRARRTRTTGPCTALFRRRYQVELSIRLSRRGRRGRRG